MARARATSNYSGATATGSRRVAAITAVRVGTWSCSATTTYFYKVAFSTRVATFSRVLWSSSASWTNYRRRHSLTHSRSSGTGRSTLRRDAWHGTGYFSSCSWRAAVGLTGSSRSHVFTLVSCPVFGSENVICRFLV